MSDTTELGADPTDTHEAIMCGTYQALREHGYAGLSIQRIADETDLSKSTFYHHFDGKDEILLSFADYILEQFTWGLRIGSTGDPVRDLYTFLDLTLGIHPSDGDSPNTEERLATYLELRSQAIHDPEFRDKFTEMSDGYVDHLVPILQDGIDQGVFADVDPEQTARFLLAIVDGIIVEVTTRTDDQRPVLWNALEAYIEESIITAHPQRADS